MDTSDEINFKKVYGNQWQDHPSFPEMPNDDVHENTRIIVQFQLHKDSSKLIIKENDEDLEWIFVTETGRVLYCRQCHVTTKFYLHEWNVANLAANIQSDSNDVWRTDCIEILCSLIEAFRLDSTKRHYHTQIMDSAFESVGDIVSRIGT